MRRALALALLVAAGFACETKPRSATLGTSSAPGPSDPRPTRGASSSAGDIAVLVQAANRKMMHDDGAGCLRELDELRRIDPKLESTLVAIRAQCEMLVGRCQAGKEALTAYYTREMNMGPDQARTSVEAIASMRCRDGDETDRDRLLRALRELTDGAYINTRQDCAANVKRVKDLLPKVPPAGPEDSQVSAAPKALFHTGAACLARAGDCRAAFEVYRAEFPSEGLSRLPEGERRGVVEASFRSGIERCKDAAL